LKGKGLQRVCRGRSPAWFAVAYYLLTTQVLGKDEFQINKKLPKEVLRALGKSRRKNIEEEIVNLTKEIKDNQEVQYDLKENPIERNKACERAKDKKAKRTTLSKELQSLKKGQYFLPSESIPLQKMRQKDNKENKTYKVKEKNRKQS